jgi:hypothetical protein
LVVGRGERGGRESQHFWDQNSFLLSANDVSRPDKQYFLPHFATISFTNEEVKERVSGNLRLQLLEIKKGVKRAFYIYFF